MLHTMILPTVIQELAMDTTASGAVAVSRAPWVRAADGLHDTLQTVAALPLRLWRSWQASRRRALEFKALRQLSPGVLRDIGIAHEVIGQVQAWSEQQSLLRDSLVHGQ
jgi:uncharacterized protein YjiS (DUF1127 family)